jgi:hypothetical protein
VLLPVIAVAGCATNPPEDTAKQAQPKVSCERTCRVGSAMPTRECAPAMSDEDRRRIQDEMRQKMRPSGVTAPGG